MVKSSNISTSFLCFLGTDLASIYIGKKNLRSLWQTGSGLNLRVVTQGELKPGNWESTQRTTGSALKYITSAVRLGTVLYPA